MMTRLLLTISITLSVLTAGLGYFNKRKSDTLRRTLAIAEAHLARSQDALAQIQKNGSEAQKQLSKTTVKLEETTANLTTAQENLKKASAKITDLDAQLTDKNLQINDLKNENIIQENKIKELTPPAASGKFQAQQEAEWSTQLAEQKTLVSKLQSQLESTQKRIEEYARKDMERQKLQTRLGLEGKVLAVNQAWNFVVLSIGNKNGVATNAEMLVKRGDQLVGKVRVTSVEPSSSIADIITSSLSKGRLIQPGDSVIYDTSNDQ